MRAGPIFLSIAGGDDRPPGGEFVLADAAVEDQLQAGRLHHRWRLSQLVQEQHAITRTGQERGWTPLGPVLGNFGQSPQVNGIEQCGSHVDELELETSRSLPHDFRLADAGTAPQVHRLPRRDQGTQNLRHVTRSHTDPQ